MHNNQIIVFKVENKHYGVDIANVMDIYEKMPTVRVPNGGEHIEGIINLRGDVITIVNLKALLGINRTKPENNVIFCEYNKEKFGLFVDEIDGILKLEMHEKATAADRGIVKGFIEKNDKQIIILDLKKIINQN